MVVVGFDVSKDKVNGARLDRSGQLKQEYELNNTKADLLPVLKRFKRTYRFLTVAAEATNEYHRPLAELCLMLNIPFRLLNPILTKQFTRATVRKSKTDKLDAVVIARLALQGQGTLVTKDMFNEVKPMLRAAVRLVQIEHSLNMLEQHLSLVLPHNQELLDQLARCEERVDIAIDTFRATARSQVDPDLSKLLQSIPGIGPKIATLVIAELGDIKRFKDAKAVIAYVGLDPKVKQSGKVLKVNTKLTKRGSPYLRRGLYLAAAAAERSDPELKATFDKKRDEGKRYKQATIVVARRIITRIYAVWKRGTPYVPREKPQIV